MLTKDEESAWQKASASLDATAKIYGYRVDSVHTETFKFLGGLNRNKKELNLKEDNNEEEVQEEVVEEIKKKEKVRRGVNTLETNIKKLDMSKYDIGSDVDPLFSVMTSKFNESTAKGLLLNTIPLDDKINYILESKKSEEKVKSKLDSKNKEKEKEKTEANTEKKKDDDDSESLKDLSDEASETKKIKDALNLANNLQKKDESDSEDEQSRIIPVICAQDFEKVKESIKKVLKSFIKDNSIDDFIHLQICPELNVFRESRKLNTEETNLSFLNTFKEEINQADKKLIQGDFDENASIMDEEEQENLVEAEEGLGDNPEDKDYAVAEDNENKENVDPNYNTNANFNPKGNENNLTVFKYEDLIERAGHLGSGNTQNLPQFMNFAKNFGKLEKNSFFNKGSMLGLKKEGGVKKKKEEKNFAFDESNEVNINDLFTDMNPKIISKVNDNSNDYEKRRKVKCFVNFDKLSQFKLFTITGKTITSKDIDTDFMDIAQQEKNLESSKKGANGQGEENAENEKENEIIGFEKNNEYDSFYQNEKKAEKNFVKLYRKFDIRALKKKIWNSYEDIKEPKVDFKSVVVNMSKNMTEEEIFSISTPTCFVCMLHLCNEKNLFIQQNDMNTFFIERDPDGVKSANYSGRKRKSGDDSSSDSD